MTYLEQILESLNHKILKNLSFNENGDFDENKFHSLVNDATDLMVTLHDVEHFRPIYINDKAKEFYGFENNWLKGWDYLYYIKTVHPSTLYALVESVKFFSDRNIGHLNLTYKLKNYRGEWKIVYGCTKTIFQHLNGKHKFALSITIEQEKLRPPKPNKSRENGLSFLSQREREILKCLALDLSTKEMAEKLNLSDHTISTYRKNLIQKMGVKSSLGLVKYGLMILEEDGDSQNWV